MDSSNEEVAVELPPLIRVYKNGSVERLMGSPIVPPSLDDPQTHVSSKDVVISPESGVSARLYLPKDTKEKKKQPLLIYIHGGAFCIGSAFSFLDHRYVTQIVSEANVIAVSVEYRLAPESPLPIAYDDSWTALQWVAAHAGGATTTAAVEPWLTDHADFDRLFIGGDSAGANIAHNLAMRASKHGLPHGVKIYGGLLVHPYFWGSEPIGSELTVDPKHREMSETIWRLVAPASTGIDDPLINPVVVGAPSLAELGCSRVLVCVAGKDMLKERGKLYLEELKKSGWKGEAEELYEVEGEDHAFHVFTIENEKAVAMIKRMASFLNSQ